MRTIQKSLAWMFLLMLIGSSANAALVSRLSGQAYYDTVLDITWIANANLADTNDFGVTGINANGTMTWAKAIEWIAAMNTAAYLGTSDWRLPSMSVVNGLPIGSASSVVLCHPDFGTEPVCRDNEYGHLYYWDGITPTSPAPFALVQNASYWSGTQWASNASYAWVFGFNGGGTGRR